MRGETAERCESERMKKKKGYWELNDKEAEELSFRGGEGRGKKRNKQNVT